MTKLRAPRRVTGWLALATSLVLIGCGGGGDAGPGATESAASADTAIAKTLADDATTEQAATASSSAVLRHTTAGTVRGLDLKTASGTYAWLGIPYAKAPVGELRWKPPVPPVAWSGVRDARQYGASCIQGGRFFSPAPNSGRYSLAVRDGLGQPVGSEDCLTLNVWRPSTVSTNLPVIFFIHGGSNISGYSSDPIYDGQVLAKKANAVVVTINYRLGLFGWLDLPQLKTGDPVADSGNFGTLDTVQALKFVQQNIGSFGGDPNNVTVMGQSAGGVNVWALLVTPQSARLFHKAVPLSGGIAFADKAKAGQYANGLATAALIADGKAIDPITANLYLLTRPAAQTAAYLRAKPAEELIRLELANPSIGNAPAVIPDGAVVPLVSHLAIAAGQYRRVPVLAGITTEEAKLFGGLVGAYTLNEYDRFTLQYQFDPNAPQTLQESDLLNAQYLPVDKPLLGWNAVTKVLTTAVFEVGLTHSMAALALQQPQDLYLYSFAWNEEPKPFDTVYGAVHAMDLPFLFGNFGKSALSFAFSDANRPGRQALSNAMIDTLSAFVRTGNPNNPSVPVTWPNWPGQVTFDADKTQLQISASP